LNKKKISREELNRADAKPVHSQVWLLLGLVNSVPGKLTLHDGQLQFFLLNAGTLWSSGLQKLEQRLGVPSLAERLNNNLATQIFDIPISNIQKVSFPWYYFMGGMHLTVKGTKFRISFIQPQNTTYRSTSSASGIAFARKSGKWWREKLKK
jgi:hypothetical protein